MNHLNCLLIIPLILSGLVGCASRPDEATPLYPTTVPTSRVDSLDRLSAPLKMNVPRAAHSAALLPDGRVLIAGGFREEGTREIAIASAEIYDPATGRFTPTNDMNEGRSGHTATPLPNGKVLIVGGWGPSSRTATAELYDPQTGKFSYTESLSAPRAGMTATLLTDGRVLIAGGDSARNTPQLAAEIYDPDTNTFSTTGSLNEGRFAHTATLLKDDRVLITGGSRGSGKVLASAEIYDPLTGLFTLTGSMAIVRYKHAAALLQDGRVLVVGGSDENDWNGNYSSAEIFDPETGAFQWTGNMKGKRFKLPDAVAVLKNGNILIAGGNRQIEIYEPNGGSFLPGGVLDDHYYYTVVTLLKDDSVLITGGYDPDIQPTDQAWLYHR